MEPIATPSIPMSSAPDVAVDNKDALIRWGQKLLSDVGNPQQVLNSFATAIIDADDQNQMIDALCDYIDVL